MARAPGPDDTQLRARHARRRTDDANDPWTHRPLAFSELGDEMLLEGRLPLEEGRVLAARCEALVDAHHRDPSGSPLAAACADTVDVGAVPAPRRGALMADALCPLADLAAVSPDANPCAQLPGWVRRELGTRGASSPPARTVWP